MQSFVDECATKRITRGEYITPANRTEFQYCVVKRTSKRKSREILGNWTYPFYRSSSLILEYTGMRNRNFSNATSVPLFEKFFSRIYPPSWSLDMHSISATDKLMQSNIIRVLWCDWLSVIYWFCVRFCINSQCLF